MSKEAFKIDSGLAKEFDELVQDEGRKIEPEERTRKTLWALDVLKQENKINSETTLTELIQIIEKRRRELRQTNAYAKDTLQNPVTDETDAELHKVAEEESKTSERLLNYMEAAWSKLMPMKISEDYSETTLNYIRDKLERDLKLREININHDEEKKRRGNN